jgi:hypothetical protein
LQQLAEFAFDPKARCLGEPHQWGRRPIIQGSGRPWGGSFGRKVMLPEGVGGAGIPGLDRAWSGKVHDGWIGDGELFRSRQLLWIQTEIWQQAIEMGAGIPALTER